MKELINHYDSFYQMILSTTLLGNKVDEGWKKDALKIINFIGGAYSLEEEILIKLQDAIINEASKLSLISDATYNANVKSDESNYIYDLKAKTIVFLQSFYSPKDNFWLNYKYKNNYFPEIHFYNMSQAARYSHLHACRQMGILYALGIGTKQNYNKAIQRLMQCVYWGDIPSFYMLACIYKQQKDKTNYNLFIELIKIADKYLYAGITEVKDKEFSQKAIEIFSIISSIFQDVVKLSLSNYLTIDYSFVEVMLMDKIPINVKHEYINEYTKGNWRDASNDPKDFGKSSSFGFIKEKKA